MNEVDYTHKTINSISQSAFKLLFVMFWVQNTILNNFVLAILRKIPFISYVADIIIPICFILVILFAFPYILKEISGVDIVFYFVCLIVVLLNIIIYPNNAYYIEEKLVDILIFVLLAFFLGVAYRHNEVKRSIFHASAISVLTFFAYQFYVLSSGRELADYNMDAAYHILPSAVFLIYWAFERKKIINAILAIVGLALIFTYGTRGPMLAMIIFLFACIFIYGLRNKSVIFRFVYITCVSSIVIWLLTSTVMVDTARYLSKTFSEAGFSTRIFDYFLKDEITVSKGRDIIYSSIEQSIKENLLFGCGLMGDRVIVNIYAHNLFLELLCQFGIVFGSLLIFLSIGLPLCALLIARKDSSFMFIVMLIIMVFTKLMLSGSYIEEPYFFLLMGMSVKTIRDRRKGKIYENCRNKHVNKWEYREDYVSDCRNGKKFGA